jgi:hypothetical protein
MSTEFEYDVFLSHNSADKPRGRRLAERLRAAGLFQFGTRNSELGIPRLCLSRAALGSDWVGLERSTVLLRDPANAGRCFIPLLLAAVAHELKCLPRPSP